MSVGARMILRSMAPKKDPPPQKSLEPRYGPSVASIIILRAEKRGRAKPAGSALQMLA
ncbi:hypothetical protein BVI434_160023 [Burkholderia vietnamiensis]|nr:hypothetical protein BVI434_160023 [Burkholderia vietnamiensis]